MTNNLEAIEYAKAYLWFTNLHLRVNRKEYVSPTDVSLNGELQYLLCQYVDSTVIAFGEVTKKDVANFIEYWIAAQGTENPRKNHDPFERVNNVRSA